MAEPSTIYKLMILYMLDRLRAPLSNTQLTDFFLEREYTSYFNLQAVVSDMLSSDLIVAEPTHSNTRYLMTAAGADTLRYLKDKLSDEIRSDIEHYLADHAIEICEENALLADYYRTTGQDYAVHLQLKEKGRQRMDLTLTVPNKEVAEAVCQNWRQASGDVYAYLMELLVH